MSKGGSAPASPDYASLIPLQTKSNLDVFNTMLNVSRVNSSDPYGSSTWTQTPTFDQSGYDQAVKDWQAKQGGQGPVGAPSNQFQNSNGDIDTSWMSGMYGGGSPTSSTPMPSRDQFTSTNWTNKKTLSPEQQRLYDANVSSQQQQADLLKGLGGRVADATAKPVDFSGAPNLTGSISTSQFQTPTYANGVTAPNRDYSQGLDSSQSPYTSGLPDAIKRIFNLDPAQFNQQASDAQYNAATRYLQPQQEQQTKQAESRLAEQGFVPGTPAYDQAMQQIRQTQDQALADARDRATMLGATVGNQQFGNSLSALTSGFGAGVQGANAQFGRDLSADQFGMANGQQNFQQNMQVADLNRNQTQDANTIADRLFNQNQSAATFGNQARNQYISELLARRQYPLNELNALRSGTQVTNPNVQAQYSTPNLQGVDMLGAANQDYQNKLGAYNAGVGQDNALLGTLGTLGGSLIGAPWLGSLMSGMGGGAGTVSGGTGMSPSSGFSFSDPRLKTNVVRQGTSPRGYPWYTWDWITGGKGEGVMATEVPSSITQLSPNGFLMVDYSKV